MPPQGQPLEKAFLRDCQCWVFVVFSRSRCSCVATCPTWIHSSSKHRRWAETGCRRENILVTKLYIRTNIESTSFEWQPREKRQHRVTQVSLSLLYCKREDYPSRGMLMSWEAAEQVSLHDSSRVCDQLQLSPPSYSAQTTSASFWSTRSSTWICCNMWFFWIHNIFKIGSGQEHSSNWFSTPINNLVRHPKFVELKLVCESMSNSLLYFAADVWPGEINQLLSRKPHFEVNLIEIIFGGLIHRINLSAFIGCWTKENCQAQKSMYVARQQNRFL